MEPTRTLEEYRQLASRCLRCSLCKFIPQVAIKSQEFSTICPSIDRYNFHNYSGGGRLITALCILSNKLQFSPDVVDVVYKCTECGGCDVSCKYLNTLEPLEVIQALREKAVETGAGPMLVHKVYIQKVQEVHNPYGEKHGQRFAWLPDDVKLSENAPVAYFVGCTSAYRRKEIAIATARVLQAAGVRFTILGEDEFCCGSPVLRVGDKKAFTDIARHNIQAIQQRGIKQVIMSCAGCFSTFCVEYKRVANYKFKVFHTSQYFARLLKEKKLIPKIAIPKIVTYHDPCHLGRCGEPYKRWRGITLKILTVIKLTIPPKHLRRGQHGVYQPPRDVIRQVPGLKLVEMERNQGYAYCCGAGGGVKSAFPDFALFTSKNRVKEAKRTGAEILVSACPFCATNLQDAIREEGNTLQYHDISEILLKSLQGGA
nr:heterodisulfide reductase-related iron-sulfur binding cluster [Candidatus Sigynarchaeum springense]